MTDIIKEKVYNWLQGGDGKRAGFGFIAEKNEEEHWEIDTFGVGDMRDLALILIDILQKVEGSEDFICAAVDAYRKEKEGGIKLENRGEA